MVKAKSRESEGVVEIKQPDIRLVKVRIVGTAPLVQAAFAKKGEVMAAMQKTRAEKLADRKEKSPRDYERECREAQHRSEEGWAGIPAAALRSAMISACRVVNMPMTQAKMSVFVDADGIDVMDGTPLVRLIAGEPELHTMHTRNATGVIDVRARPMWRHWMADVSIRYDNDMISASSVINLLSRAGQQVGIGEGRPFSKASCGLGWGTFEVAVGSTE